MDDNKISEFEDYSNALNLFKKVYLYEGYKKDIREYATSYIGRGENDVVRNDAYSSCIEYDENGVATWKIISPKNIFGIEVEHVVNHKNHNKVTSSLILNSGRFDLNRMMVRFAQIDITDKSDDEILKLAESILSKNNEQIIMGYAITENPNGILLNAVISDIVLSYLKSNGVHKFPKISCNAMDGSILVSSEQNNYVINNDSVRYGNQYIKYNMISGFPDCRFEIDGIKGDNNLFSEIYKKLSQLNSIKNEPNIVDDILEYALQQDRLKKERTAVMELYKEYLEKDKILNKDFKYD